MAEDQFKGITWDPEPAKVEAPIDTAGITWDKPSVWEAMKQGAKQAFSPESIAEYSKQIPPAAAARMAAPVRLATGVARLPANLMRMAGVETPSQVVGAAEQGAKQLTEGAGYKGMLPGAANIGGELITGGAALKGAGALAPAVEAIPGGAAVVKGLQESPMAQSILGGMGLGAAGSTGTQYDVLKEAGLGGLFGGAGQAVASGLGHVAAPVLKRYQDLKKAGYTDAEILKDTTIGQFFGGITQKAERALEDIPFGGVVPKITAGIESLKESLLGKTAPIQARAEAAQNILGTTQKQAQTLEQRALSDARDAAKLEMDAAHAAEKAALKTTETDVHVPIINYALKPLGIEVPAGVTGNQAMKMGQDAISDAYTKALSGMTSLKIPESAKTEMRDLSRNFDFDLGPYEKSFEKDVERLIGQAVNKNWLTPDKWQGSLSDLSKRAYKASTSGGGVFDANYGKALNQLKDKWMDLVEGQVGGELFKSANTAFSKFKIPEKAATYAKSIKAEGEFSPNELINALKSELSTKRLAGGEDEIQQLAVAANKKMLADREALAAKHAAEKRGLGDIESQQARSLEDKFTGLEYSLARQKAAIKNQAEKNVAGQEKLMGEVTGPRTAGDYAGKRLGYMVGTGGLGLGSYGLAHALGIDPMWAAAISGGAIGGTRVLYSNVAQNGLKNAALKQRPAVVQQAGEALRQNAPLAGLTAVQQMQSMRGRPGVQVFNPETGEEITPPQGGLQVPR